MVKVLDMQPIGHRFESWPLHFRKNNPRQVVHMHMTLSPSSVIWYRPKGVMLYGRRSGVALAMRHRLSGISTCGLNGLGKEDEHPPISSIRVLCSAAFQLSMSAQNALQIVSKTKT